MIILLCPKFLLNSFFNNSYLTPCHGEGNVDEFLMNCVYSQDDNKKYVYLSFCNHLLQEHTQERINNVHR